MRIRQKEIRKSRKREEERIKAEIKVAKGAKTPVTPTRQRTRKAAS
jgi:hypothetical protein